MNGTGLEIYFLNGTEVDNVYTFYLEPTITGFKLGVFKRFKYEIL